MSDTTGSQPPRRDDEAREADDALVPAAGGTFGVTDDRSGFGAPTADEAPERTAPEADPARADAAEPARADAADDAIDHDAVDELAGDERRASADAHERLPADGGTFGVTDDRSGYAAPAGRPLSGPGAGYAAPAGPRPGFDGYGPGADGREFAPAQYGRAPESPATADRSTTTGLVALVLAVVALVLLCIPGWAWIVAAAVAPVAVVLGALSLRSSRRYALLALIGGGIALLIAIATAIVVLLG